MARFERDFETDADGVKTNRLTNEIVGVLEFKKGGRVKIQKDGDLEDGWIIFKFLKDGDGSIIVEVIKKKGEETLRERVPLEKIHKS